MSRQHRPKQVHPLRWYLVKFWRRLLYRLGVRYSPRRVVTMALLQERIRAGGDWNRPKWEYILRHDACVYCGERRPYRDMTIEHIQPKSHRGRDTTANKAGCCYACNQTRGSRPLLIFLLERHQGRRPRPTPPPQQRPKRLKVSIGEVMTWRYEKQDQHNRKPTDIDLRSMRTASAPTRASASTSSHASQTTTS